MASSTKISKLERVADALGINRRFHTPKQDNINMDSHVVVSPVQATVASYGPIRRDGLIIIKSREITPSEVLGYRHKLFLGGQYINLYLRPTDKHYWRTPYDGEFVYTKCSNGEAVIPIFIGLERILKTELFSKAIKKNASIASILQTKSFPIGMIAVGSLNVNSIHTVYNENQHYDKGEHCGYFSIGSSMLILFPKNTVKTLVKLGNKVDIGEPVVEIV